jgi:TatD DNase family protein
VRALAEVTGTDLAELCATLTATAERVFGPWELAERVGPSGGLEGPPRIDG